MSADEVELLISPQQYLMRERAAEIKSEYFNGRIYAMSGASRKHNIISVNLTSAIHACLSEKRCEVYSADMRVKSVTTTAYMYPDVVVVCGEPQFEDTGLDTLINPLIVIEILSPSTEKGDRSHKFAHYRRIASLREFIMIAQERSHIEQYILRDDGWLMTEHQSLTETLRLSAITCDIPLSAIYAKVPLFQEMGDPDVGDYPIPKQVKE